MKSLRSHALNCRTVLWGRCALLVIAAASALPAEAVAMMGLPGPYYTPFLNVHRVKLGTWAEYAFTSDRVSGTWTQRIAVLARDRKHTTVELTVGGGPRGALVPKVTQLLVPRDPKRARRPTGLVLQFGNNQPMRVPPEFEPLAPKETFYQVNASELKGKPETIEVPAGSFSAQRYTDDSQVWLVWLSEKALPFGVVKSEAIGRQVKMELVKQGQGAKSGLNGNPIPFDQDLYIQQARESVAGVAGFGDKP